MIFGIQQQTMRTITADCLHTEKRANQSTRVWATAARVGDCQGILTVVAMSYGGSNDAQPRTLVERVELFLRFLLITFKTIFQFEQLKGEQKRTGKKILLNVLIYMVPGITIFLLLPSVLFRYIETDWTYLDSVYYAFISLATIGFGDLVNGEHDMIMIHVERVNNLKNILSLFMLRRSG